MAKPLPTPHFIKPNAPQPINVKTTIAMVRRFIRVPKTVSLQSKRFKHHKAKVIKTALQ